jgi:hypothetical protein
VVHSGSDGGAGNFGGGIGEEVDTAARFGRFREEKDARSVSVSVRGRSAGVSGAIGDALQRGAVQAEVFQFAIAQPVKLGQGLPVQAMLGIALDHGTEEVGDSRENGAVRSRELIYMCHLVYSFLWRVMPLRRPRLCLFLCRNRHMLQMHNRWMNQCRYAAFAWVCWRLCRSGD